MQSDLPPIPDPAVWRFRHRDSSHLWTSRTRFMQSFKKLPLPATRYCWQTRFPVTEPIGAFYGTVKGSTHPIDREGKRQKAVPVLLHGGIKASFFDSECDIYCGQAYLDWQQNGYYYSIGIEGPNPMRKSLLKVANSAVGTIRRR